MSRHGLDAVTPAASNASMLRVMCATTGFAWLLLAVAASAQHFSSKYSPEVVTQLDRTGEAEVFVMLREPSPARRADVHARRRAISSRRRPVIASLGADARIRRRFGVVSGFAASVNARGLAKLLTNAAVLRVDPIRFGSGGSVQSGPQIRADVVHRRDDLGQGVTVAVLDAGVDSTHPDLAGSVVAEQCFCSTNCCPNGGTQQSGPGSAATQATHGIHVTGIIVSKGMVAPEGVAPAAKVVAVKVLDDQDRGNLVDWVGALDWIATDRPDVQAINMSLVSDAVFPGHCDNADSFNMAFAQVLGVLRDRGTLTFVAAGNGGEIDAMGSPACVDAAVAMGAVNGSDLIANFSDSDSSLGLVAPGVAIVSTGPDGTAAILTGTSMATPHATGTAALMLAINPTLTADQLENILKSTGRPIVDKRNGLTVPRVDALAAMNTVLQLTKPLLGGGSRQSDCLVEWDLSPATETSDHPFTTAMCRDNDATCDGDRIPGQCTFELSLCFNVPDRRLPRCMANAPIVEYQLSSPSAAQPVDAIDAANAAAIGAALPAVPITDSNRCTDPIPFVVPTGTRWIRFLARADDGRVDYDRLRLACVP